MFGGLSGFWVEVKECRCFGLLSFLSAKRIVKTGFGKINLTGTYKKAEAANDGAHPFLNYRPPSY
jgi:hypothetical protein